MCDAPAMPAAAPARTRRTLVPNKCVKCKSAQPRVAVRQIRYCKACFVQASVTKFRTAQSKVHRPVGTKTMVAFSGGAASSAMLRLVVDFQNAWRKGTDAEPPYAGLVIGHVDESALFPDVPEDAIRAEAAKTGLVCEIATLEDAFALDTPVLATVARGSDTGSVYAQLVGPADGMSRKARLAALFAGLGSITDKEDMLEIIKTALIADMARRSGCGAVLMGDSATRVAVRAMALTSRGRGFSLPLDVGAEAQWFGRMVVQRPMREFLAKEIAFFNRWTGQQDATVPGFATGLPKSVSIGRLAEAFIVELDRDFASTVSTVCRTLQKLEPREEARTARPCTLC
ncbi:Cytoplasmic tRNA 2-thiolation protein 2 [Coemansia helicoidea]|uniref:Cytoplasmic tRNA 2-thiolation protein 2 n=1 Tax=Coemansia helicoidea TaxID=1286919 RepID=A0ACC1LCQ3_9FUNG|nr:Cytoplasmic tRNA 2-thiolation protein 2 [Coemansia helicoidea]